MPKYKVISAIKTKEHIGQYDNTEYALSLQDESGKTVGCTILQKPLSPIPSGEIEGDIESSQWGMKFKKAKPAFGGFGGSSVSSKANPREHAQEMALRFVDLQVQLGALKTLSKEALIPVIDWFVEDASKDSAKLSESKPVVVEPVNDEVDIDDIPFD